jgi:hypothetical protein
MTSMYRGNSSEWEGEGVLREVGGEGRARKSSRQDRIK